MPNNVPVITIDGPSGAGKGTICAHLAKQLNFHVLDSGAIYRVFALAASSHGIAFHDSERLLKLAETLAVEFYLDKDMMLSVSWDGRDVSEQIREESCAQQASVLAKIAELREALLSCQRQCRISPGLVADGRDMGTVVFPDAILKIFLTASAKERAKRRCQQLRDKQINASLPQVLEDMSARDGRDSSRLASPLKCAGDVVPIDTTEIAVTEVVDKIMQLWHKKLPRCL